MSEVKFIRVRGRIIPIKKKDGKERKMPKSDRFVTHSDKKGNSMTMGLSEKKVSAGERFKSGFKFGFTPGAVIGGASGALAALERIRGKMSVKKAAFVAGATTASAAVGGVSWGTGLGALNAALGNRKKTVIDSVSIKGKKKKFKKAS